jgi:hypothetical protein
LGGISGSGSTGYLPKFTGTTSIGNSIVQDNGSTLNIAGGIICNAISASSLTSDQYIAFQNINTSYSLSGYTLLYATLTNPGFIFNYGDGTRSAIFRYAAGSYTYTLPSATGTLALTSDITSSISGTTNYIPKFTGSNSIGNSVIYESSSNIGIGTISPNYPLHINSTSNARIGVQGTTNFSAFQNINSSGSVYWGIDDNAGANFTGTAYGRFIYSSGAYPLIFFTNSTEGMRLDASGRLGIGTTSPLTLLNPQANNNDANTGQLVISGATSSAKRTSIGYNTTSDYGFISVYTALVGYNPLALQPNGGNVLVGTTTTAMNNQNGVVITPTSLGAYSNSGNGLLIAGAMRGTVAANIGGQINFQAIYRNSDDDYTDIAYIKGLRENATDNNWSSYISFETTSSTTTSERMRITSAGDVFIGNTAAVNADKLGITYSSELRLGIVLNDTYTGAASGQIAIQFRRNGSAVGDITTTTTSTAYNTSSDYRLKQDLKDFNGLSLVNQINVYDYQWKSDNTRSYGVMAHELQSVLPYAVTGVKDGEKMQGVDYSKIVPILIKSIKELKAEIETLKNK